MWKTGSNKTEDYSIIIDKVKHHINNKGVIAVGTDSMIVNRRFVFVTAICLIEGSKESLRGRYFYKRKILKDDSYKSLSYRIFQEASDSIDIANKIVKEIGDVSKIEIHLDVNKNKIHLSNKYANSVSGYAQGCGYKVKIKPDAFAASSVADWYTRPTKNYVKKICP